MGKLSQAQESPRCSVDRMYAAVTDSAHSLPPVRVSTPPADKEGAFLRASYTSSSSDASERTPRDHGSWHAQQAYVTSARAQLFSSGKSSVDQGHCAVQLRTPRQQGSSGQHTPHPASCPDSEAKLAAARGAVVDLLRRLTAATDERDEALKAAQREWRLAELLRQELAAAPDSATAALAASGGRLPGVSSLRRSRVPVFPAAPLDLSDGSTATPASAASPLLLFDSGTAAPSSGTAKLQDGMADAAGSPFDLHHLGAQNDAWQADSTWVQPLSPAAAAYDTAGSDSDSPGCVTDTEAVRSSRHFTAGCVSHQLQLSRTGSFGTPRALPGTPQQCTTPERFHTPEKRFATPPRRISPSDIPRNSFAQRSTSLLTPEVAVVLQQERAASTAAKRRADKLERRLRRADAVILQLLSRPGEPPPLSRQMLESPGLQASNKQHPAEGQADQPQDGSGRPGKPGNSRLGVRASHASSGSSGGGPNTVQLLGRLEQLAAEAADVSSELPQQHREVSTGIDILVRDPMPAVAPPSTSTAAAAAALPPATAAPQRLGSGISVGSNWSGSERSHLAAMRRRLQELRQLAAAAGVAVATAQSSAAADCGAEGAAQDVVASRVALRKARRDMLAATRALAVCRSQAATSAFSSPKQPPLVPHVEP